MTPEDGPPCVALDRLAGPAERGEPITICGRRYVAEDVVLAALDTADPRAAGELDLAGYVRRMMGGSS